MTKKSALLKLITIIILAIIGIAMAVVSFNIPGTSSRWNSFVGGLNKNTEINSGLVATYNFELINDSNELESVSDNARQKIYNVLSKYYSEPVVSLVGNDKLRIQISGDISTLNQESVYYVLTGIGGEFDFKVYDDEQTKTIDISQVKSFSYQNIGGTDTLIIRFDKEGTKVLENLTKNLLQTGGNLNIKLDEENIIQSAPTSVMSDGTLYISGGYNKATVVATLINLLSLQNGVTLTYSNVLATTPTLGIKASLSLTICAGILILAIAIFMIVRYKNFGLMSLLSLAFFGIFYSFLLNVLPFVKVTFASVIGILTSFVFVMFTNVLICEKIKEEYKLGKKVPTSMENGLNKTIKPILDISIMLIVLFLIFGLLGSMAVTTFASTVIIGIIVNLLTSLVLLRQFFKISMKLTSKPNKYNLQREETTNEN